MAGRQHCAGPLQVNGPGQMPYMDRAPQPSFDALAAAAARIFGTSIALILLQDGERLWYKSRLGVEWLECPVRGSFSRWLLARDEDSLAVADATLDPRFADDEAVTGPIGIRFYAGAPLVLPSGARIGAICVMDRTPRDAVDPGDMAVLSGLARTASALIESHRQAAILQQLEAQNRLSDALGEIALGTADYAAALGTTAELLGRNLSADAVTLTRYDPSIDALWRTATWSSIPALATGLAADFAQTPLRNEDGPGCAAVREQRAAVVEDVADCPGYNDSPVIVALRDAGISQYLVVPMQVGAERCGISIGFRGSGNDLPAIQERILQVRSRIAALLERKEAHDRLAFLGSILDRTSEGMSVLEVDPQDSSRRRFVYVNSAMTELTGYSREELIGAWSTMLQPTGEDGAELSDAVRRLSEGEPVEVEVQNRQKSGARIWVNVRVVPFRSATVVPGIGNGGQDGRQFLISSARDVGEKRRMLDELRAQEAHARKLFEQNPVPMWLYDRSTLQFRDANGAALRDYGYDKDEFLAMHLPDLHPADDQPQLRAHLARPRIGLRDVGVWRHVTKAGAQRFVKIVANDYSGAFGNWILVAAIDVTREKSYEQSLLQAKYQAEQANAIKSEFLAHMSHEMRTPLNAVIGFAEMLRSGIHGPLGAPKYEDYVDAVRKSGSELLAFVNDVLQLIEIDASAAALQPGNLSLRALVQDCLRQHAESFSRHHLRLGEIRVPDGMSVTADQRALRQVLGQVLDNLVKFCDGAMVNIGADLQDDRRIALQIADNGPGIQEDILDEIFSPFFSSRSSTRRVGQGAGLGLPICQRLLRIQGGDIRVASRAGEGTEVTILLPVAPEFVAEVERVNA